MNSHIPGVFDLKIPPLKQNDSKQQNQPIQNTALKIIHQPQNIKTDAQKKKHILSLLKQIKHFQTQINILKSQPNQQVTKQIQQKIHLAKLQQQQIKITPVNKNQSAEKATLNNQRQKFTQQKTQKEQKQEKSDPFSYEIIMLKEQNNLLKEQNDLLKQQSTLKLKITKTDQLIFNQSQPSSSNSNFITKNIPQNNLQPNSNHISSNFQSQNSITSQQLEAESKTFVRSNQPLFHPQSIQFSPPNLQNQSISENDFLILPSTNNNNIFRPNNIKRKNAGKILFVKPKAQSLKINSQIQGFITPPYSLENYEFIQQTYPTTELKRRSSSEIQLKTVGQGYKTVRASQLKSKNLSFKKKTVSNSKEKLIKQNAFDKINLIKNSLSQRKFSAKKQTQNKSKQKKISKHQKEFQIKLLSDKLQKRPLNNDKIRHIESKNSIEKNNEVLEFNTEKEKIDFDNMGFSSILTDKKILSDKKIKINFHNINLSQLNTFQDFLKLVPQIPHLTKCPTFQSTQQQFLSLAKQTFPLFKVNSLQSPETDLNIKKFKNCIYFGINSHHNILWHYDGKIYFGSWKVNQKGQGQKSGQGLQFYPTKYIFKGQFSHGKRNGQGILHFLNPKNQSIYIGQFVNGKKEGRGKFIDQMGNNYEGQWKDDKRHGLGLYKYANGDIFEGTFKNGERQGFGVQKFNNGDIYRGEYKNDKFCGKGHYVWKNTSQYEGEFKNGKRNGQGIWKSSNKVDAEIYQGEYVNDKKQGYGIYRWSNGSFYQGYFMQDKKHGIGKTRYQNGKVAVLQWVDGVSVKKVDKNEWPEFLMDQNQTTIKTEKKPKLSKPKINTFFQYEQISNYQNHQNNEMSETLFDVPRGINQVSQSRPQPYQFFQNQITKIHDRTFTGEELKQAQYQPMGTYVNNFQF